MARSTILDTKTRRKSLRVQCIEPPTVVPSENVARARRRSASSHSSSSSSHQSTEDGPYRRLRTRRSFQQGLQEEDRKPSAAVLKNATNSHGSRKRTTSISSAASSQRSSSKKKQKGNPRLSVTTKNKNDYNFCPPLTYRQHQKLNQVTPSPTSIKHASPTFSFNSPIANRKKSISDYSLPTGVLDLYPAKDFLSIHSCTCGRSHCSPESLSSSFIQSYGKEYWQYMKDNEEPAVDPPSPSSSSGTRSSIFASPQSSHSPSSVISQETPDHRRDWVYIDTSGVNVAQPDESTRFLHYQPELTPKMRAILIDWIIELSEHFHFGPSTLHHAITLTDTVLACGPFSLDDDPDDDESDYEDAESKTNCFLISRERFQLLGAACTWLACKYEELDPPNVSEIAYVSDNIYTTEQIKRMERRICRALGFSLSHQTPYPFIYEFVRASNECSNPSCEAASSPVFLNMVNYLLELGRLPYGPVTKKPSLLAAASVYLARVTLGVKSSDISLDSAGRWTRTLQYYTGYTKAELKETVMAIHSYHLASEDSSLKSVFTKYKSKKYNRIALKTVPGVEDLGF